MKQKQLDELTPVTDRMERIASLEAERGIARKLGIRAARHVRLRYDQAVSDRDEYAVEEVR